MKFWVILARVGCVASVAGFFLYLAARSVSIAGAKGEEQLYIIYVYFKFAIAAAVSALALWTTVVTRAMSRSARMGVLVGDAVLGLLALLFSVGLWLLWRL